ncbi:MAG: glycoside hydrolase family 3 C-terminal domain-containing protein [Bacteroidota bacterium]
MNFRNLFVLLVILSAVSCNRVQVKQSALLKNEARIDSLISVMTLEEKIEMLHAKHMFVSAGVERLGIADMNYVDGPFGIREELEPDGWSPLGWETDRSTFFPTGSALAATWSPELAYAYGTAMAKEARLRGKDMLLGPAINIQRIPTGGRTYEYLSEDPFLSSRLSVGYTKGVQDNGVAVCLKHYALNNQEDNRGMVNVVIGERAMREVYLPPFQAAVEEADAWGVMSAYNKVNGYWCSENDILLNKILRDDWGFAGMVVSDWSGTHSTVPAIMSGLNVEMPGKFYLGQALLDSVNAGAVPMEVIDQRVREILRVRLAVAPVPADQANKVLTSQPESQKTAYDVACKSIVLLKNDGILPLDLSAKPVIAVIGANARQTMANGGLGAGVKALYEFTPLEGLLNRIGDKAELIYAEGYVPVVYDWVRFQGKRSPEENARIDKARALRSAELEKEALALAGKADIILFIGGDNRAVESEGNDRTDIFLPSGQDQLIRKLADINPNIVTVLTSGAPNDLNVVNPLSKALLISWFNGSEGGNALADVLTGAVSPSGRLPFTLPLKLEDVPAYALGNYPQGAKTKDIFAGLISDDEPGKGKVEDKVEDEDKDEDKAEDKDKDEVGDPNIAFYSEESLVGYRWYETKNIPVMYPFGYGLSYTTFSYSDLVAEKDMYRSGETIAVSFNLTNTGSVAADEVPQLYVHRVNPAVEWPAKELKAFTRVNLAPGETRQVKLEIPVESLRYWNEELQQWSDDPCEIELLLGASVRDVKLTGKVRIE